MNRYGLLLGVVCLGTGVGTGIAAAAPIAAGGPGAAGLGPGGEGDATAPAAFGGWPSWAAFAGLGPDIDTLGSIDRSAAGIIDMREIADGPPLDAAAGSAVRDAALAAAGEPALFDIRGMLSPPADFPTLSSGGAERSPYDLIAPPSATDAAAPAEPGGDLMVEAAVPVLTALALPVAAVLLFGVVRRQRRLALARRVKLAAVEARRVRRQRR